jgi:hypothetical protein
VEGKAEPPPGVAAAKESVPREAFNVIGEKNIFNPDRKEFSTSAAAMAAKPVTRPQITLFGVVMAGDYQSATIINPGRTLHKGERETKTIKVGESVGEYKLAKILPDRIVMEGGEDSFEILLYDPRTPKRRTDVRTPAAPATVTTTSPPAAPAGGAPPSPAAPLPPSSPPGVTMPGVTPRPVTPFPVPRAPGSPGALPEGVYQAPSQPVAPSAPPSVPDPSLWRGRRPISPAPGGPPG